MYKLFIPAAILFSTVMLITACDKNEIKYGEFDVISPDKALLKINFVSSYQSNPTVYLALDGNRVSNPITSRTPFPGGGYNTGGGSTADYMVVNPGAHKFSVVIPQKGANIGVDSIKLFETDITVEGGKYQTLHITDTTANTKSVMLSDNNARPDSGYIRYKFVNLIPNAGPVDLYYDATIVAPNVDYLKSAEFTMPLPAATKNWTLRPAGSTTLTIGTPYSNGSTITNRRVYTIFALGYKDMTDTRKPYISFLLNL